MDLGKGLKAWSDLRFGRRTGKRVGFPRFKKKTDTVPSFRLRNKHAKARQPVIRVGENDRPRSVTLPGIGQIAVHDDTRRVRRMIANGRARILFATVRHHAGRWWVSLNIEAAELHPAHQHPARDPRDDNGWLGIDRGLSAFMVAADAEGTEIARVDDAPKALAAGIKRQRRLAKSLSRKQKGSQNRRDAAAKLSGHHHRGRQHAPAFPAPGVQRVGQDPRPTRHRRPERDRNDGQPSAGARNLRRGVDRIRQTAGATNRPGAAANS